MENNKIYSKININAMKFCRGVFAVTLWCALIFKLKYLVLISCMMMFLNVIFTIENAPLIWLYNKFFASSKERQENIHLAIMQIVHFVMFLVNLTAVIFIFWFNVRIGYSIVIFMAFAKTIAAFGFCPVSKLTNCSRNGCCVLSNNKNKDKNKSKHKNKHKSQK